MSTSGSSGDRRTIAFHGDDATRARVGDAIRSIIEAASLTAGPQFFTTLVRELSGALAVRHALIAEYTDISNARLRTIAFWSEGRFLETGVYDFTNDKCAVDITGADSYCGVPLVDAANQVIGHLAILDTAPFHDEGAIDAVMRACAAVASRELERVRGTMSIATLKEEIGRLNAQIERDRGYLREVVDTAHAQGAGTTARGAIAGASGTLEDVERAHILATLAHTGWVIEGPRGAALILGMHPNTLRSRMKKLGLERARHGLPPVEGV